MQKKRSGNIFIFLAPVLFLAVSIFVVTLLCRSGTYPNGSDVMYHIYRGDWLYRSIEEGNWYPLLNPMWYNGVQLLRYWAPLPAYFMALCKFLAGGDIMYGYLIFVGAVCFLGAMSWFYVGLHRGRPWMGTFLGLLWFFMPGNLYVMFVEGNLARCMISIFLPLLLYAIYSYLETPRWTMLAMTAVSFLLTALCHLGYSGMVALSVLLFLLLDKLITRRKRGAMDIISAMLLAFLVMGIWVLPSLTGGITSIDSSESMRNFFQDLWISLNPFARYETHHMAAYFGLAAVVLAVFGILFSRRRVASGFLTGILLFLSTASSMYQILRLLPGGKYLWMMRFISIALCLILMSFLFWSSLRRPFCVLLAALLVLDTVPSLSLLYGYRSGRPVDERLQETYESYLIQEAQDITGQRIALIDLNALENGSWYIVDYGTPTPCAHGAGWEAAKTGPNISQLERAVNEENYLYCFDRCKQLGCDTVLMLSQCIKKGEKTLEDLDAEASAVGYSLVDAGEATRLYHMDVSGNWGTVSRYRGIAIGDDVFVTGICRSFPALEEADSANLNDYTFEELSQYDLIYLSAFTYDDRVSAEELVLRLSESGVRIVIAADGIPEERGIQNRSFLGVLCNPISFSYGYPELETVDGILNTDLFPEDYRQWSTVYTEGLDEVWGSVREGENLLDFYGTVKNDNIVVVGLNLTFFLSMTQDPAVERLLSRAMDLSSTELPRRRIVPLDVSYGQRSVTIRSPEDGVNTSLAFYDIFQSDSPLEEQNRLLVVDQGTTEIQLVYPYLWQGLAVSALGVLLTAVFLFRARKWERKEAKGRADLSQAEIGGTDEIRRVDSGL